MGKGIGRIIQIGKRNIASLKNILIVKSRDGV
jgi:hypothetical protein